MPDDDQNKPNAFDEARESLRRIETLLETAVKELKQIRAIVGKGLAKGDEVSHSDSTACKTAAAIGAARSPATKPESK